MRANMGRSTFICEKENMPLENGVVLIVSHFVSDVRTKICNFPSVKPFISPVKLLVFCAKERKGKHNSIIVKNRLLPFRFILVDTNVCMFIISIDDLLY